MKRNIVFIIVIIFSLFTTGLSMAQPPKPPTPPPGGSDTPQPPTPIQVSATPTHSVSHTPTPSMTADVNISPTPTLRGAGASPTPTIPIVPTRITPVTDSIFSSPIAGRIFITSANISQVTELARISPTSQNGIVGVDFSPDGRYIAVADNRGSVHLYDFIALRTGDNVPVFSATVGTSTTWDVEFHPYRDQIMACNSDSTLTVLNFAGRVLASADTPNGLTQCNYSRDGEILAVAGNSEVVFYQLTQNDGFALIETRTGFGEAGINDVIFSHDDTILYTAGDVGFSAWNIETGAEIWSVDVGNTWSINPLPNGNIITTGSSSRVELYNPRGTRITSFSGHSNDIIESAYNPSGDLFVSGSWDYNLRFWDATGETTQILHTVNHGEYIVDVGWSRDGALVATVGNNGLLILWGIP